MTRPQRHQKHDRLMHSGATEAEVKTDFALGPFDKAARAMDAKWGVNRLPDLASPATGQRWAQAMVNLNAAIGAADPELVAARVAACLRGFDLMDKEAEAAGHHPITPEAWEFEIDGKVCALLRDDAAWPAYSAMRPGVRVYTIREVVNALAAYGQTVAAVKDTFPGAQVTAIRKSTPLEAELADHIPF
jgi:hypothetical protein